MQVVTLIVLCCAVGIQTQRRVLINQHYQQPQYIMRMADLSQISRAGSGAVIPGHQLGPIHVNALIGQVPAKYMPLTKDDEVATQKISSIVQAILRFFPNSFSIESIAPINLGLSKIWFRGDLHLTNLVVRGINQVAVHNLEWRLNNDRIDFSIDAPHISADVNFELEGRFGAVPVYLSGSVSMAEQELKPSGSVGLKKVKTSTIDEAYQLETGDVIVDVPSIVITIKNADNIELDSNLDVLKTQVVDGVKDQIAKTVMKTIFDEINKILAVIPASSLLAFFST